jgi:hypothetical protein
VLLELEILTREHPKNVMAVGSGRSLENVEVNELKEEILSSWQAFHGRKWRLKFER